MIVDVAPATLLAAWERGQGTPARQRALQLLELAMPERSVEELPDVSVNDRDRALRRLRQSMFGVVLSGYVDCPACSARLSVDIELPAADSDGQPAKEPAEFVSREGLRFRAPNSGDLAAMADAAGPDAAVRTLLRRCCTSAPEVVPSHWSDLLIGEVEAGLAELDPDGELCLDFSCADCGCAWQSAFDPAGFVWEEIEAHAISLLQAVDRLASTYGWSERDILAMSATRRAAYLELTGA